MEEHTHARTHARTTHARTPHPLTPTHPRTTMTAGPSCTSIRLTHVLRFFRKAYSAFISKRVSTLCSYIPKHWPTGADAGCQAAGRGTSDNQPWRTTQVHLGTEEQRTSHLGTEEQRTSHLGTEEQRTRNWRTAHLLPRDWRTAHVPPRDWRTAH